MEVHPHLHATKKKWVDRFWDFLFIFLAVVSGFLAENIREHKVESHKAKDYAISLANDLKEDTAEIRLGTHQTEFIMSSIDSVVSMASAIKNKTAPGLFYYYSRFTTTLFVIDWSKSTINQLTQSGNLRYFSDKKLVDLVNKYFALQGVIANQNQTDWEHRFRIMDLRNRILLNRYYVFFAGLKIGDEEFGRRSSPEIDRLVASRLPLQDGAEKILDEYLNHLLDRKWRMGPNVYTYYRDALELAGQIIDLINKDYHLK